MLSIFSNHNAMRLDINYKKKTVRSTKTWRLNNTFLDNRQVTDEIKRDIRKFLETNDKETTTTQSSKSSSKRYIYSNTILPQETRNMLNREPNFIHKTTGKRTTRTTKTPKLG